jgi:hypothetical protein
VLFIINMTTTFLSVSCLDIEGFGVTLFCGRVFLYLEGDTLETIVFLGVMNERVI